ncbi:protoporphyrinogen oxidase HemJ [Candidatus Pelagibacter sp.]|nr:protoporphyrinogen oxidase HemJ [Candidatus Pelagibacter sp.]
MNAYLLFKSLHLISVISWMAGLLYLPRIFVYHAENNSEPKTCEIFKIMEKKLFFYIMTPAMILSWLFGLLLIYSIGFHQLGQTWMLLKIVFVIILTIYHFYLGRITNRFKLDINKHTHKFYRIINEIPTVLLILIIFTVIFKPI